MGCCCYGQHGACSRFRALQDDVAVDDKGFRKSRRKGSDEAEEVKGVRRHSADGVAPNSGLDRIRKATALN